MAEAIAGLRWYLEIDGITEGIFKEVTGLDSENEVIENRVTGKGGNLIVQKIPGALKWSNIVLKRGVTDDKKLWEWRMKIQDGLVENNRRNGTLTLYSPDLKPVAVYTFKNGWPCKYTGPSVDASKNEVGIEELVLAHEGIERTS
jgi:phage tail-like protein